MYNNCKLFVNTKTKSIDFVIGVGKIICIEEVETISILFFTKKIELYNVALISDYDLNLILLDQFKKSRIIYYNNSEPMTLIKDGKIIAHTKKNKTSSPLTLYNEKKRSNN